MSVGETGGRRVRAHAAGVGPPVAVAGALVVARRRDRRHRSPVAEREDADLAAAQPLLDQYVGAATRNPVRSVPLGQHVARGFAYRRRRRRPCRPPSRRPSPRTPPSMSSQRLARAVERVHDARARSRDTVALHEALREDLARLEPARERSGPNVAMPSSRKRSATPGSDRRLRPEHGQFDARVRARRAIARPSVAARSDQFSPRVAVPAFPGHGEDGLARRRLRQPPRQRVLARSAADDENAHRGAGYSHSTVAGGFDVMSYATRLTPGTSLTIRVLTCARAVRAAVAPSRRSSRLRS